MSIYVGMDVHRKRSQIAMVDEAGDQQRNCNLPNDPAKLVPILGALAPGTPVAFEAAYGWGWLVELLEDLELEPHRRSAGPVSPVTSTTSPAALTPPRKGMRRAPTDELDEQAQGRPPRRPAGPQRRHRPRPAGRPMAAGAQSPQQRVGRRRGLGRWRGDHGRQQQPRGCERLEMAVR